MSPSVGDAGNADALHSAYRHIASSRGVNMAIHDSGARLSLVAAACAAALASPAVMGQQAPRGTSANDLEEIVVSARRREENVQDVPISIVALNAEALEFRGVQQLSDLSLQVPNIVLMGGGATGETSGNFHMRGIPGIATYVDGVWQSSDAGLMTMNVVEVERVEVLRGPQGTLFGKNSTGGAIQYVTKLPTDEFGAKIELTGGEYDRRDVVASVDVPVADNLAIKLTGAQLYRDGFITSRTTGRKFGDIDDRLLRGDFLWTPSDDVTFRFIAESTDIDRNGSARTLEEIRLTNARPRAYNSAGYPFTNATHVSGFPGGVVGRWETMSDVENDGYVSDLLRVTIDGEVQINDNLLFKTITGYRDIEDRVYTDWDAAEITLIEDDRWRANDQLTQEFQIQHSLSDRISYVAGFYYWNEYSATRTFRWTFTEFRTGQLSQAAVTAAQPGFTFTPGNSDVYTGAETSGQAIFGEVNVALTDKLDLTVGVRFNDEEIESYQITGTGVQLPALPDTDPVGDVFAGNKQTVGVAAFDSTTPRVSIAYDWRDNLMVYASYAEGFGAGGINVNPVLGIVPYGPEELSNYEIGLRSDWWDGNLRVNATAFDSEWEGIQLSQAPPDPNNPGLSIPNPIIVNAAAADASGIEIETNWSIGEAWRIDASLAFLDTAYTNPGDATQIQLNTPFAYAPERSYSIGVQHTASLANSGRLVTRLDYGWMDDYERSREIRFQATQEAFGLLNARVVYEPPAQNWRLSVFGTNLSDEKYLNSGMVSGAFSVDAATVGRPREVGASLQLFFD
jgi:iron complex outermembrane receptor protein